MEFKKLWNCFRQNLIKKNANSETLEKQKQNNSYKSNTILKISLRFVKWNISKDSLPTGWRNIQNCGVRVPPSCAFKVMFNYLFLYLYFFKQKPYINIASTQLSLSHSQYREYSTNFFQLLIFLFFNNKLINRWDFLDEANPNKNTKWLRKSSEKQKSIPISIK